MNSYGLKRVRDAAEAAETDGRAITRYSQALACAIAALEAAEAREAELRARVAELEGMAQKWVPVSERLPEIDQRVLWRNIDGNTFIREIDKADWPWWGTCTHWMPLPAAPKEES